MLVQVRSDFAKLGLVILRYVRLVQVRSGYARFGQFVSVHIRLVQVRSGYDWKSHVS